MGKKFWGDVFAFIAAMVGIGGFVLAVGHHYMVADVPDPVPSVTVYEDGSWVQGDESGCIPGGLCEN